MIGKLKFDVLSTPIELDLKKVTILLGEDNVYSYGSFNTLKHILTKEKLGVQDLKHITCDTDLFKIEKGKILKDNRNIHKIQYLDISLYSCSTLIIILKDMSKNKDIFILDYVDSKLSPKDSIALISYLIKLYKEGKRLIIRTCNIFTMYYLNVLFLKGEIKEEDLAIYNLDSRLNTSNLLKDSNLKRTKEIDLEYFNEPMNHIHEELFKILIKLDKNYPHEH